MDKEINKYLRKISAEKLKKNHKECVELYNIVGGMCSDLGSYEQAIEYHQEALKLSKNLGDRIKTAVAFRYIGECQAFLGQYHEAVESVSKYLDLSRKAHNQVELQRAYTTMGRVYLMQARDLREECHWIDTNIKEVCAEAETNLKEALSLTRSLGDEINEKEIAQMKCRLYLNLGMIKDTCNDYNGTITNFKLGLRLAEEKKLKEELFMLEVSLAGIFRRSKHPDQKKHMAFAARFSEKALATAKQLGRKILICEAYIESGLVKIMLKDFKNAKRTFAQAYLARSPNEEDNAKAIKLTKISHLIATNYDLFISNDISGRQRMELADKLGDLFVNIKCYKLALEFYRQALIEAKKNGVPKHELAKTFYSLAETYSDDEDYEAALICYEKELKLRNGNDKEQCQTLLKMAHMHEFINHDPDVVKEAYEKALKRAAELPILMYNVIKDYVCYLKRKSINSTRVRDLSAILVNLKSHEDVIKEIEMGEVEDSYDPADEVVDVDDVITDDEENDEVLMVGRKKCSGNKKFKANEVGDTPLHEACIKGDLKRVQFLINHGHEVNPRDNAGWIPLHEACNHGHFDIAEYLVEHGADIDCRGLKGMTPLHDAATNGHLDIMRLLISSGANVIALTDTGESVLMCLRDYRERNYSSMSNEQADEYRQVYIELKVKMEQSGYNLMDESLKRMKSTRRAPNDQPVAASNSNRSSISSSITRHSQPRATEAKIIDLDIDSNERSRASCSNSVREYRDTIGNLKRKRPMTIDDDMDNENTKKLNLPATFATKSNTSANTKDWLIDDVSKQAKRQQPNILDEIFNQKWSDDEEVRVDAGEEDDDDDEPKVVKRVRKKHINDDDDVEVDIEADVDVGYDACDELNSRNNYRPNAGDNEDAILGFDQAHPVHQDDLDEDVMLIDSQSMNSSSPSTSGAAISTKANNPTHSLSALPRALSRTSSTISRRPQFDLFGQPLLIEIANRKLIVPIQDPKMTIGQLKSSIVDRYLVVLNASTRPSISLAPRADPRCFYYDQDLCADVIRCETLVAHIDAWQLDSCQQTYIDKCKARLLEPIQFISGEMRLLDEYTATDGHKLDMTYFRLPPQHLAPVADALTRRPFVHADLTGSACLFRGRDTADAAGSTTTECAGGGQVPGGAMLASVLTWTRLTHLTLRCVGLNARHFERLCTSMDCAGKLQSLDVSYNCIAYRCHVEFARHVRQLLINNGGHLARLNVRKNHLKFDKLHNQQQQHGQQQLPLASLLGLRNMVTASQQSADTDTRTVSAMGEGHDHEHGHESAVDFEIVGADEQNDYLYM